MTLNIARPCCRNDLTQYRHKVVRDLVWSLCARDLFCCQRWPCVDHDLLQQLILDLLPALAALDADPAPLIEHLERPPHGRLGTSFERLLSWAFDAHSDFRLLATGVPVRDHGRSLGEFDLVLEHPDFGCLAIEATVKFWLAPHNGEEAPDAWIGPDGRDSAGERLRRLVRQLTLAETPEGRRALAACGARKTHQLLLARGRLFHPWHGWQDAKSPGFANPEHARGWWATVDQFLEERPDDVAWIILDRSDWLAPICANDQVEPIDSRALDRLLGAVRDGSPLLRRPLCLAALANGNEIHRGFVVSTQWAGASGLL